MMKFLTAPSHKFYSDLLRGEKMKAILACLFCFTALSADILQVTEENFNEVTESTIPVIIDVNAKWCHACQQMVPIMDTMDKKYDGQVQFAKVDFDSQGELAKRFGVTALPTFLFFKAGQKKPVMKQVGGMSESEFDAKVSQLLKK
jgi:thioredoxin 1